jgi:hypothetical protein
MRKGVRQQVYWRRAEVLPGFAGTGHFLECGVNLDIENSLHVPQNLIFGSLLFWALLVVM